MRSPLPPHPPPPRRGRKEVGKEIPQTESGVFKRKRDGKIGRGGGGIEPPKRVKLQRVLTSTGKE